MEKYDVVYFFGYLFSFLGSPTCSFDFLNPNMHLFYLDRVWLEYEGDNA